MLPTCMAVSLFVFLSTSQTLAAGKPQGAEPVDPQRIITLYSGKTTRLNSGARAYWAPGGEYHGINKRGTGIGIGIWFVNKPGMLCNEVKWYWSESGQTKSYSYQECWEFVVDQDGTIWERYISGRTDWYRHEIGNQTSGDSSKTRFERIKARLGL